ncbi:MAG: hypothetical protein CM1200mP37_8470 [Chloroflexota bacterium]|nr:MAG: hypothetical protein CM1200mP37_8470 [Chloroflexota bacterium]
MGVFGSWCPRDDDKGKDSGSAYIFKFNGTAWIQEAKLVASDGGIEDAFGTSVDIDNGRIMWGVKRILIVERLM